MKQGTERPVKEGRRDEKKSHQHCGRISWKDLELVLEIKSLQLCMADSNHLDLVVVGLQHVSYIGQNGLLFHTTDTQFDLSLG